MAFDQFGTVLAKSIGADRAQMDLLKRTLETEFSQALDQRISALNLAGSTGTPATDPAVLNRLAAVEQSMQDLTAKLATSVQFDADTSAKLSVDEQDTSTTHDRLTALETALSSAQASLQNMPDTTANIPATPPTDASASATTPSGDVVSTPASTPAADPNASMAPATPANPAVPADPVQGGADNASATAATPAFAPVQGDTATTVPPVEIAPGTGQFVDPHATNPAAVATGAPAPVSGSAGQPGGDTTQVLADSAPNSAEAGRSAPQPTAANVASPGPFDPISARANPAPFANTEQDAPKAPVINAVPSQMPTSPATPVSANTSAPGTVGQQGPNDPAASS